MDPRFTKEYFLAQIDGEYQTAEFEKKPVPIVRKEQLYKEMYLTLRYRSSEREEHTRLCGI